MFLYNGGKDSSLATSFLNTLYDMTLVTAHFEVTGDWTHVYDAAAGLGCAFETLELDREVAAAATVRMVEDSYPHGGIQHVHEYMLETICGLGFDAVVDGTCRDDRVSSVSRAQAQSLEGRYGVDHLPPLSGFNRDAVDHLIESHLDVEISPFEEVPKTDYEGELHHLITAKHGQATVDEMSPDHVQSYTHGRR